MKKALPQESGTTKSTHRASAIDDPRMGPLSVNRGLDVLGEIAESSEGLTLANITHQLELPKSSLVNILKSLEAGKYVSYVDGRYQLDSAAFQLAQSIHHKIAYPSALIPILERAAQESNDTAVIAELCDDHRYVTYAEVKEGDQALRFHVKQGERVPSTSVIVGQVLLASLAADEQSTIVEKSIMTKKDRAEFMRQLETIPGDRVVTGSGGYYDEIMGIAAPVYDATGTVRCALAIGGPINRIKKNQNRIRALVVSAAFEMSAILGHKPKSS